MKRFIFSFILALTAITTLLAQPRKIEYEKENDFLLNVFANPNFSLYDFLCVGLSERNTDLRSEDVYKSYSEVRKIFAKKYGKYSDESFHRVYKKISASWKVFKEVQYTDVSASGFGKYMMKPGDYAIVGNLVIPSSQKCPNPELKHKLSIVPLKLDDIK